MMHLWIQTYGFEPSIDALPEIRSRLILETSREQNCQGLGDTELMKLCCLQLFRYGLVEDSLVIWDAKISSMDASGAIDVEFLCGAGLQQTQAFLADTKSESSAQALNYLHECEQAGDFEDFDPETFFQDYQAYYS